MKKRVLSKIPKTTKKNRQAIRKIVKWLENQINLNSAKKRPSWQDEQAALRKEVIENKRIQKRQKKKFEAAWRENKPKLNITQLMADFESQSKKLTPKLLKIVLNALAINNATNYTNDALRDQINAVNTSLASNEIITLTNKLSKIKILFSLFELFKFDKALEQKIAGLLVEKEFGPSVPKVTAQKSEFNVEDMMRRIARMQDRPNRQPKLPIRPNLDDNSPSPRVE